ncbi:2Fe-2S iron-sulfur cluster-binding protein [Streptomyces sp.]|uniref:2Fe-2S iron-sulfur cluster-binding protein n=1 Tax=Streptomyces sp. TaxID=1931 RepID=UPI002F3F9C58
MTDQEFRLPHGGRIDRNAVLRFTVDGRELTGHPGDTVASVMLASGLVEVAPSIYRGRPRGITAAGVEEPNALLQIDGPHAEGMLPATTVELYDGLCATTLSGMSRLDPTPDPAVYDKKYVHTDVLVVGAGPAGLAAAAAATGSGARVIVVDDQPEPGGSLLSGRTETVGAQTALDWVAEVRAALDAAPRPSSCSAPRRSARRTTTMCWPCSGAPTTSEPTPPTRPKASRVSGCGTYGPARWSWRPAPTSVRWSSPATTGPG